MNWHYVEHVVAILGVLSMLLHALEAGCEAAGWTKYQGIFSHIYAFLQGFLGQIKPPAGGAAAVIIIVALMGGSAFAQTVPDTTTLFQKAGAKSGIIYCPKTNQVISTNNITMATYKMVDLTAGMARTDGVDVALSVDIAKLNLPVGNIPVLNLVNFCNLGIGAVKESGVKDVAIGGYASISWKF